jgi:hypothetical protein
VPHQGLEVRGRTLQPVDQVTTVTGAGCRLPAAIDKRKTLDRRCGGLQYVLAGCFQRITADGA